MKKLKMLLLPILAIALLFQGCVGINAKSNVFEEDLNFENMSVVDVDSAKNSRGKEITKVIDNDLKSGYNSKSKKDYIELEFSEKAEFDTILLRENGWKVNAFHIEIAEINEVGEETWRTIYKQDAIEDLRICSFETVSAQKVRIVVDDSTAPFSITEISVYKSNPAKKDMRVTGYLRTEDIAHEEYNNPESNYYMDPNYFTVLNQGIIFGGVNIEDDGSISLSEYLQNGEFEKYVDRLRNDIIKENDVDLLVTFAVSANPLESMVTNKDKTIQNIVDFLIKYDFQGINFDREFPNGKEQYNAFGEFLIELDKALDKHDLILSCAFYSWGINLSDEAIKSIDQIEIMGYDTYDRMGNDAGFVGTCVQPIKYFLDKGVSKEAISLGVPFFGRTIDSEAIWRDYDGYNLRRFDNAFYDTAENELLYFNGAQMIADKVAYAVLADIGGIMVFNTREDIAFENETSLVRAVGESLDKYTTGR